MSLQENHAFCFFFKVTILSGTIHVALRGKETVVPLASMNLQHPAFKSTNLLV
jgi:hypothetical protein